MAYTDYSKGTRHIIACTGSKASCEKEVEHYKKFTGPYRPKGKFDVHRCITGARRWYGIFQIGVE